LLQSIREKKSLTEGILADLNQVLKDFKFIWAERSGSPVGSAAVATSQPVPATA
jgi:hypothetical protein